MNNNHHKSFSLLRRRFISNGIKLAVLSSFVSAIPVSCKSKTKNSGTTVSDTTTKKKVTTPGSKKRRQKWSHESLVINSKTGVMHLPSSRVYHYYDEIKPMHIQDVAIGGWTAALNEKVRFNRQQSGTILEILALQQVRQEGTGPESLGKAADILARAFSDQGNSRSGKNLNETNFRLHELMLQLIALNNTIPPEAKYQAFLGKVKKPESLRKRQRWMSGDTYFNERVKYILEHENDYITRLNQRAAKYSFT